MNRRSFLQVSAGGAITLPEFQPKSTLRVAEHPVDRAKFPVIDVHTHLFSLGRKVDPASADSAELLRQIAAWMDHCNLRTLINLTGGTSETIPAILKAFTPFGGKFKTAAEPTWARANDPGYAKWQADELGVCKRQGAIGLKILKTLGLVLRDTGGHLIKVDDPRFDPMWEAAGSLGLPVLIHTSDPAAFFQPIDRFNERWEELGNHPDWSFYGKDYPTRRELHEARNRVIARHPKTTFVGLHVANNPEDLGQVSEWLDRWPNLHVEIGARLGELGRQPRTSRKFFDRYQDRILFGTDATPRGESFPQQDLKPAMFRCYFRYLETEDEYFDYSPAAVPPQGRWRIYGIGLPDSILRKVYHDNAARLFALA
ncbi:MAG: amidohydrolase family protein [Candidatus Solibacter usitatus]|nr:amidohydrolase family protein [Candidatus Solibacter usitatus]